MWSRLYRCTKGVAAVEFALMLPILVMLVAAVADFGLAVNEKMRLTSAARAGAQWAYKKSGETGGVALAVQQASGLDPAQVTIGTQKFCGCVSGATVSCLGTCNDGNGVRTYVTVSVSESWAPVIVSSVMDGPVALTGTVTLRVK
ncbi:MAG TPA: TadE/TadG family type IV pilus assembly protein [Magnetospirillum sp.]|nr:TadE/TadG family type IV pilus assembly protein [Magnetospirillum sp.]